MDDRVWKNISIVLGVVCALLIGVAGALMIVGSHRSGSTANASASPSGVVAVATDSAAADNSGGPSASTSGASQSHGPTAPSGPTPTPGKPSPATITFTNIGLDASTDAQATTRTFTFISDGAGPVTFAVTKISAGGTAKLCINVDGSVPTCKIGTPSKLPTFPSGAADQVHSTWSVTLIGYNSSAPTVDLTFTWPTATPKVTLTHGRFQGTPEAFAGFSASFKPRASGSINIQAAWTLITTKASMTLYDASGTPAIVVDQRQYDGVTYVNPAFTSNVDPTKTYQVKLLRTSPDSSDRPDLTAQITFP